MCIGRVLIKSYQVDVVDLTGGLVMYILCGVHISFQSKSVSNDKIMRVCISEESSK